MDDPVVAGIGRAAAFYGTAGSAQRATPLATREGYLSRSSESHPTTNVGRPRPGYRLVRILDRHDWGDFLAVVNRVNFVPSCVSGVINPVAGHHHNVSGLQVAQSWTYIRRISGSSGI